MRRVVVRTPQGVYYYATNGAGEGVFVRAPYEGAYKQLLGTCQTPVFRTPQQFRRWLRCHLGVKGRTLSAWGWD
jgi:hypothetical protein